MDPPLDEQVFSAPSLLASWGAPNNTPTTDTIHIYFAYSPFFDRTSNNAVLLTQAQYNPHLSAVVSARATFEAHLRSMTGVEYMVTHEPSLGGVMGLGLAANGSGHGAEADGAWVIRKQIRRRAEQVRTGFAGEVEGLAVYFAVGHCIFQAPALRDVLGARLLGVARGLGDVLENFGRCVGFEMARGHGYPLAAAAAAAADSASSSDRKRGVDGSRDVTPMVEIGDGDDDGEMNGEGDFALLAETFTNSARFGKEYMDEHPLVGEPGNFIIQKSKELQVPAGGVSLIERKGIALPNLTVKTDLASAVSNSNNNKRDKGGEKSPVSPTGTGATKKKKKDKSKAQTPKGPKTPGA